MWFFYFQAKFLPNIFMATQQSASLYNNPKQEYKESVKLFVNNFCEKMIKAALSYQKIQ